MTMLEKLRAKMLDSALDAIFIYDENNLRYISDFSFQDGFIFLTRNSAHLFTDFRYYEMALSSVSEEFTVVSDRAREDTVRRIISKEGIKTAGIESDTVSYSRFLSLGEAYPTLSFKSVDSIFVEMRRVKTDREAELIAKAQSITDEAFSQLLSRIKTDMTEIEVAAEIEYSMRRLGADGPAFDTIAVSGESSSIPHGVPRNIKLRPGFLTMDFGAKYKGYCSDMTRTVVIGRADSEIKRLYSTVLSAQTAALDNLRAGVDLAEADSYARDVIESVDEYKGSFGHALGHGVGLLIHESPSLSARMRGKALVSGEVVTVEPGIYLFGKYGCRIEDMVRITDDGIFNFTHSTKELIEI